MSIRDVLVSDIIPAARARPVVRATTLEAYHQQKMKEFVDSKLVDQEDFNKYYKESVDSYCG